MSCELVTGHSGTSHVSAEDTACLNGGIIGQDDYVLDTFDLLEATVVSANRIRIGAGDLVMQGRHVTCATPTELTIANGSVGMKRNDLITCRYTRGADKTETAELQVIKGDATAGTPLDPTVETGSIWQGASAHDMPLYRIPLDGITVGTPVPLFNVLKPMADVWDSLTPIRRSWRVPYSNNSITLTRMGHLCFAGGNVKFNQAGENNYTTALETIPLGFRPVDLANAPLMIFGGNTTFLLLGSNTGKVTMLGNPNSAYAAGSGIWVTDDPMPSM